MLMAATGETIPIRLFLGGFDLTPTFREVNKKFSVRYYLNLVLIDEENRRYFKQQVVPSRLFCLRALTPRTGNHDLQNTRSASFPALHIASHPDRNPRTDLLERCLRYSSIYCFLSLDSCETHWRAFECAE